MNSNIESYIEALEEYLPERKTKNVGRPKIPVRVILFELIKMFKHNYGWRDINHKTVCYKYLKEMQRRGEFKNFFKFITKELNSKRLPKTIIDSSDIVSYKTNNLVKYSGKYHNYCIKVSLEITPKYIPVDYSIDKGSKSDSLILDKIIASKDKLPYELYLDKGYERYDRRRILRLQNCQVRMESKKYVKSRKRGPKFKFTHEDRKQRGEIEKVFSWLKSFRILRLNRLRKKSLFIACFIICLSAYTHYLLNL
jgi:Transposase DDE domain